MATSMMMKNTPPRTPPRTGARGNFLPPSLCTKFVGEDGAVDDGEESDEVDVIRPGVVVRVPKAVED